MVDKSIGELVAASQINDNDLFVLEQSGEAKKLLGNLLKQYITRNVMSVSVSALPPDSEPMVSYDPNTGTLELGIPRGEKGESGESSAGYVSGIVKGDGAGNVSRATPNSDYLAVPSGGSDGDVLKKTSSGTEWGKAGDSVPALDEDVTYYVSSSGSDSGDGTQGSPFATVTHALSLIPKNLNGHVAQINVLSNLTESITIFGYYAGTLRLYGQNTRTITGGIYIDSCSASILLTEFAGYVAASAEYAIRVNNSSDVKLWCEYAGNDCSISSGSAGAIRADSSRVRIGSSDSQTWTISGSSACIVAYTTSQIALNAKFALSGSTGIRSYAGSVVGINSTSFENNASTKYSYGGGLVVKGSAINPTS